LIFLFSFSSFGRSTIETFLTTTLHSFFESFLAFRPAAGTILTELDELLLIDIIEETLELELELELYSAIDELLELDDELDLILISSMIVGLQLFEELELLLVKLVDELLKDSLKLELELLDLQLELELFELELLDEL
jgi:hypothetical protein